MQRGLAVAGTAEGSSCHPTEREAGVCLWGENYVALSSQKLLFSSQVHVLRDVPALKAGHGRTFYVSDVQPSSLTAESPVHFPCTPPPYNTPEAVKRTFTPFFSVQR